MPKENQLLNSLNEILNHLNIPLAKEDKENQDEAKTGDPLEDLIIALKKLKKSANKCISTTNDVCTKAGINKDQAEKGQSGKAADDPKLKELSQSFRKELKNWEKDLVALLENDPDLTMQFLKMDFGDVGEVKKKTIKKKKKGKRSKWLSA